MQMNEAQLNAVQHKEGPMLVIAGPGERVIIVTGRRSPVKSRTRAA